LQFFSLLPRILKTNSEEKSPAVSPFEVGVKDTFEGRREEKEKEVEENLFSSLVSRVLVLEPNILSRVVVPLLKDFLFS
jgi:hypothetical protein